jgi:tRNA pseudouridine55 synthase
VVDRIRDITKKIRVGHAGTLDPNATGLLIIAVGRSSTKKLGSLSKDTKKTYEAQLFLGEERDTHDIEGKIVSKAKAVLPPSEKEVKKNLSAFVGSQMQIPPEYSAKKIKGKKAYQLARKGKNVQLKPKKVNIYFIELKTYQYPFLDFTTEVSSGTYIRALARDIGRKLGMGAYLKNLRRTRVGEYDVKDAKQLGSITKDNWKRFAFTLLTEQKG